MAQATAHPDRRLISSEDGVGTDVYGRGDEVVGESITFSLKKVSGRVAYAVMSLVTALTYAADKLLARRGSGRRVSERTLHLLELLGGWPGALVAQQFFKHKRRKPSFFFVTWLIAVAHVAVWAWAWRLVATRQS